MITLAARIAVVFGMALASSLVAQRVRCEAVPKQVFEGQKATYHILVRGEREAKLVAAPATEGLTFTLVREGVINESVQRTFIGGRMEERVSADYVFSFEVQAAKPGSFVIPAPRVAIGGREMEGTPVILSVEAASSQDLAFVEMSAENERVVQGEMVRVTVDVSLKHLPAALGTTDPLSQHDRGGFFEQGVAAPELSLPWLPQPPIGLTGFDLEAWAKPALTESAGLRLDARTINPRARFKGEAADVERQDAKGRKTKYRRYRFQVELRAETAGRYDFPAASVSGNLVEDGRPRPHWREIFARSAPLAITVEEPPAADRPPEFRGAVGVFRFTSSPPTPPEVMAGDPVYLTLVVEGEGFLKGVEIDLESQLGPDFRVDPPKVIDSLPPGAERPAGFPDRAGTWRQFECKLRPLKASVTAIPELRFAYFDTRRRAYEVLKVPPVPIRVRDPGAAAEAGVVVASGSGERRDTVELVPTSALSGNVDDLNLLGNHAARPLLPLAVVFALGPLYFGLAAFVRRRRALKADPSLVRRRKAGPRAAARLAAAKPGLASDPAAAVGGALQALLGFVADLEDRAEEACTSGDLVAWAVAAGLPADVVDALRRLGEAGEEAAFGGGGIGRESAAALIDAAARALDDAPRPRRPSAAPAALLAAALVPLVASAAPAQDLDAFRQAQAAYQAGRFDESARLFQSMLDDGYENGHVLYNLGNAHLRAGRLGRAIAAYRRASLLLPGDANIQVNLKAALDRRRQDLSLPDGRGVPDYVFFWRRALPFRTQAALTVAAAALAFLLALVQLGIGRRLPALRWSVLLFVLLAAMLGAAAGLTWRHLEARDRGAIAADGTLLRQWPGPDAERSYEQPVDEGAEFLVLDRRDGWLKVRVADRYEGWLPESSAALW